MSFTDKLDRYIQTKQAVDSSKKWTGTAQAWRDFQNELIQQYQDAKTELNEYFEKDL